MSKVKPPPIDVDEILSGSLLNNNTSTGRYSTTSHLISGRGSGGVAMTINDGYGNANLTYNHVDGRPEQNGVSGRIEVNTDNQTASGIMQLEVGHSMQAGVKSGIPVVMQLRRDGNQNKAQVFGELKVGSLIMGNSSIKIASKPLTVTIPSTLPVGDSVYNFAHGLNAANILRVDLVLKNNGKAEYYPEDTDIDYSLFRVFWDASNVKVRLNQFSSSKLRGQSVVALITYKT